VDLLVPDDVVDAEVVAGRGGVVVRADVGLDRVAVDQRLPGSGRSSLILGSVRPRETPS
jgi:hypothetical protein